MHSTPMLVLFLTAISACGGREGGTPVVPRPSPIIEIPLPHVVHPRFAVVPAELGDPGIAERLTYRTRISRWGKLWLKPDGEPARSRPATEVSDDLVLPVIDASRARLRVVIEDDDMRYAAWIARDDAATVPIVPIQLADRAGHAVEDAGVFLDPGATIELGVRADHRREVILRDDAIRARGFVPATALGEVWPATHAPRAAGAHRTLDAEAPIRVRPDPAADVAAIAATAVEVVEIAAESYTGWTAIEIARPFARVRGFVPAGALHPTDGFGTIGHGSGHGFGISDTDRATLAVGTCLFDTPTGEVIGVNLVGKERYANAPSPQHPGWWAIYVDSPWQSVMMYAHDTGTDPKQPLWEACGSFAR